MRKLTFILAAMLMLVLSVTPSEARHRHHKKARACTSCAKAKCNGCSAAADTGYRAAAWGSSVYYTSESCPGVAAIPKDKLITGQAATFGRRKAACCCAHS